MSVGAVMMSLLAIEIYLRATWHGQWAIPREAATAPGIFSMRLKPDHQSRLATMDGDVFDVTTNARGFRGPLVSSIAGRRLKVVFLGDSFTFGWGVRLEEQGLWRFLEHHRSVFPDQDVGYAFVASPSWNPKDYYLAYLTEMAGVKPDLVVVGLFTGNDVLSPDTPRELDPAKVPYIETIADPPAPWFRSLEWLSARLSGTPLIARLRARQGPASYDVFSERSARQLWDTTFFYLEALHRAVERDGARMAIVLYPSMLQVSTPDALREGGYNPDLPEQIVAAFAREQQIDCILVLDALRAGNGKGDLYFPQDRHLTPRGHAVTAEVFARTLDPVVDRLWRSRTGPADAR